MRRILRIAGAVVLLASVLWLMLNGAGLQDSLPFGAGAYYYADIPDFDKYLNWDCFQAGLPYWVYVLLFLIWGVLMYLLWIKVDSLGKKK